MITISTSSAIVSPNSNRSRTPPTFTSRTYHCPWMSKSWRTCWSLLVMSFPHGYWGTPVAWAEESALLGMHGERHTHTHKLSLTLPNLLFPKKLWRTEVTFPTDSCDFLLLLWFQGQANFTCQLTGCNWHPYLAANPCWTNYNYLSDKIIQFIIITLIIQIKFLRRERQHYPELTPCHLQPKAF